MNYRDIGERFIRYASINTQSKEGCPSTPSTACQRELAVLLRDELEETGASEIYYDEEHCYVYAAVPGNIPCDEAKLAARSDRDTRRRENNAPVIGLMAHMDTSDAVAGTDFHPRRIDGYDGGDIILNAEQNIILSPQRFPSLEKHIGHSLVVTDGTSVLGGDDKAGIAAIMEVMRFYLTHPEYAHGTIRCCFTPDEEVGNGPLWLDQSHFACDYAYTVDGGDLGQLEYENFNAAGAAIRIRGISTHPGSAKGTMKNALLVAAELAGLLPPMETPYHTEGYEGFYHLESMHGSCDEAEMLYIIRDHDRRRFEERKRGLEKAVLEINRRYGEETAALELRDSYYNMEEKIRPHMHLIDNAVQAMKALGIEPLIGPIRGGTDGCRLSFEGIPCPNLGTGAYHFHSRYEYVSIDEMQKNVELLVRILNRYAHYELDEEAPQI
ncbi:peptidase T [Lachnoclostridium sp. Marseille-P6806]|uniref:peptidase T n=1 Tax=Lachnoclostridium sp. Marseille-P6806 TaxID=2364793 RepID=UPI001031B87C|nr:peptidase T [Lachnoclostridium sp. Marseille-P6806]